MCDEGASSVANTDGSWRSDGELCVITGADLFFQHSKPGLSWWLVWKAYVGHDKKLWLKRCKDVLK